MNKKIKSFESFDLKATLECGQCFRWKKQEDGSYKGIAFGKILNISEDNKKEVIKDKFWGSYFDISLDYDKIRSDFSQKDEILKEAAKFAPGMRILNQEPWEALCSFIISQNNNIPRICGIVDRLCSMFGENIGGKYYTFPEAQKLSVLNIDDLADIRSGFRAKYIIDAAKKVADGEIVFEKLKTMPLSEARENLMKIKGVGPKVADCTLLYGLHRLDAFPMDVWIKRAMSTLFPGRKPESFGKYAGIAQQYIFYYSRNNPQLFTK